MTYSTHGSYFIIPIFSSIESVWCYMAGELHLNVDKGAICTVLVELTFRDRVFFVFAVRYDKKRAPYLELQGFLKIVYMCSFTEATNKGICRNRK